MEIEQHSPKILIVFDCIPWTYEIFGCAMNRDKQFSKLSQAADL